MVPAIESSDAEARERLALRQAIGALSEVQTRAVTSESRVLAVIAGAGSGKTRVLTLRVAHRIDRGDAREEHVEVVTFSRKAADELRTRLWRLGVGDVRAGTFHRRALALLRDYRQDRRLPAPVLLSDRRAALVAVMSEGGTKPTATQATRVEAEIGWAKARLVAPGDYVDTVARLRRRPPIAAGALAAIYRDYERRKARRGVLDLDDLLWEAAELIEGDQHTAEIVHWRSRHLFVDECQDMNPAQYRLLRAMVGNDPDLFVVGDPNQSLYGWNGADPELIGSILTDYPGTEVLRLEVNHRCSPEVIRVANSLLESPDDYASATRESTQPPRLLVAPDDESEATQVASILYDLHRSPRTWSQMAVLTRTNAQLRLLAEVLSRRSIPVVTAGTEHAPGSDLRDDDQGEDDEQSGAAPSDADARDAVTLTTFHRAKGLEWPVVVVAGLATGIVPHRRARSAAELAEERRSLYVAITRAIDLLVCTRSVRATRDSPIRDASPWWKSIEAVSDELRLERRPGDPQMVRERVAQLRRLLDE